MDEDTFIINIKDGEPMIVPKNILTANSPKFRFLIDELKYEEHDMTDFSPEAVTMFLAILADRNLTGHINNVTFRELHKLARVFEVHWMRGSCCRWLRERIDLATNAEEKTFLFEECWYIFDKWKDGDVMNALVSKKAHEDNAAFISGYIRNFETLETGQIDILLKLGESNTELFLQAILQNLIGQTKLTEKLKYILQNMNLPLCHERNEDLYFNVFETIADLSEINVADMQFVHKTASETTRLVSYRRKNRKHNNHKTLLYDGEVLGGFYDPIRKLTDILKDVKEDRVKSMYLVVEQLLYAFTSQTPNIEQRKVFLASLESISIEKSLQKVSIQYLVIIIVALGLSNLKQSDQMIDLLIDIKNNKNLSTLHENVVIKLDRTITVHSGTLPEHKELYIFKHPGIGTCTKPGKCGFILRHFKTNGGSSSHDLITDSDYYKDTGIHYHKIVSAQDMFQYSVRSGFTDSSTNVTVMGSSHWEKEWLPEIEWSRPSSKAKCIAYNISDYLVAKKEFYMNTLN